MLIGKLKWKVFCPIFQWGPHLLLQTFKLYYYNEWEKLNFHVLELLLCCCLLTLLLPSKTLVSIFWPPSPFALVWKANFSNKNIWLWKKKPGITWMDLIGFFKVPLTPYKSIQCLHSVHSHFGKVWHAIIYQLYTKLNVQYLTLKKSCAHVAKSKRNFGEITGAPPFFLAKLHLFLLEELNYIDSNN